MKIQHIPASLAALLMFTCSLMAQDYAIVSTDRGYLLNPTSDVVRVVHFMATMEITGQRGDFLEVSHAAGTDVRIHKAMVYRTSMFPYVNEKNTGAFLEVLKTVHDSNLANDDGDQQQAAKLLDEASARVDKSFAQQVSLKAWLLTMMAYQEYPDGSTTRAIRLLDQADELIAKADAADDLFAADAMHARGLFQMESGEPVEAELLIVKAMNVAISVLGTDHSDLLAYLNSQSYALEHSEDYGKAIAAVRKAGQLAEKIYPASAIELAEIDRRLGTLFYADKQKDSAIAAFKKALKHYQTHNATEQYVIACIQFELGDVYFAMENYDEAERWYGRLDFGVSKKVSETKRREMVSLQKETLNSLALIAEARENNSQALVELRKATALIDADNPESVDGLLHRNVGYFSAEIGDTKSAIQSYQDALEIYAVTDGKDSDAYVEASEAFLAVGGNKTLLAELSRRPKNRESETPDRNDPVVAAQKAMEAAESEIAKRSADRTSELAELGVADDIGAKAADTSVNYAMIITPTERMLVTKQDTALMDGANMLRTVPKGTRLWSTEKSGEWNRVYYAPTSDAGWIADSHSTDFMKELMIKSAAEINARYAGTSRAGDVNRALLKRYPAAMKLAGQGNFEAAIPELEALLGMYEELAGEKDVVAVTARSTLANSYFQNRQYVKCRKLVETALPLQRSAYGADHPRIAAELNRLAGLLNMIGDIPGTLKCNEEALKIAEAKFFPTDPRLTGLRMSLAQTLAKMGDLRNAGAIFSLLLETESKRSDGVTPVMPTARFGLAKIKAATGDFQKAVQMLRQVAEEYRVLGDAYRFSQRDALFELSRNLVMAGEIAEGRKTLELTEQLLPAKENSHPDWIITVKYALANQAAIEGDLPTASLLTEQCIDLTKSLYREDNVLFRELHSMRGKLRGALGKIVDAAADFDRARQLAYAFIVNTLADQPVSSQVNYIRFSDSNSLNDALSLALKAADRSEIQEQTATWLLNSKNLANELAARDGQIRKLLTHQNELDSYDLWLDTRRRLVTLPKLTPEEAASHDLKNVENELLDQEQRTFDRLPPAVQALINNQRNGWVQIADVRQRLRPDEVFIDFMRLNLRNEDDSEGAKPQTITNQIPAYVAWVIPATGHGDIAAVNLGQAGAIDIKTITPMLDEIGRTLAKRQLIGDENATRQFQTLSAAVADSVWKPLVAKFPPNVKRVILCPDSNLWRVPWASLPTGEDRFLIEDFEFRFVSSGRSLLVDEQLTADLNSPTILADPDYSSKVANRTDSLDAERLRSLTGGKLQPFDASFLRDALPETIAPLPGTAQEARTIQPELDAWSGASAKVLLRAEASEAEFRRVNRPHTLFIGTHGFYFPEIKVRETTDFSVSGTQVRFDVSQESAVNPLRRCGLLLAGCSDQVGTTENAPFDGILTGEEIVAQDLRGTKLVVLSACETGIGDLIDGQGVAGLRQAIQLAGAESVVSTLWSIEDNETAALMSEFFRNLAKGSNKSEALRQAQLSRIEARRNRFGAAHPFFWAAFTLTGQR